MAVLFFQETDYDRYTQEINLFLNFESSFTF